MDSAFPRVRVSKALMPACAECDGQCSDVTMWTGPGATHFAAGPRDAWRVPTVALATGVKGVGSRQQAESSGTLLVQALLL